MLGFASRTIVLISLGMISACHTPKGPYLTGNAAVTTAGARAVDALWMIALPPVVVRAPREPRPGIAPTDRSPGGSLRSIARARR